MCNRKFEEAMRKAIKEGREQASEGVYVDPVPLGIRLSVPHGMFSGCGSAAAMCLTPHWPR
jgi:hypothetical protein